MNANRNEHRSQPTNSGAWTPPAATTQVAPRSTPWTPVTPHTWAATAPQPYATDEGQARVLAEQTLLQREYPGFEFDIDENGTLYAHGHIGPHEHLRQRYHVLCLIPPGYGAGIMPQAYLLDPTVKDGAPHIFNDKSLCLDHSGAFTSRSTLITFLAWVSIWLVLYEHWVDTGERW